MHVAAVKLVHEFLVRMIFFMFAVNSGMFSASILSFKAWNRSQLMGRMQVPPVHVAICQIT